MAISQRFIPLNEYFLRTDGDKIVINDLKYFSLQDNELLNRSLMTVYNNTDTLSTIASCDCGELTGNYLLKRVCKTCGTRVKGPHEKVQPLLWLHTLEPGLKFLNPDFWLVLTEIMGDKIDCLRWMCDPKYNPPVDIPNWLYGVKTEVLNDTRDYMTTMEKIPEILMYMLNHSKFKERNKQIDLELCLTMFVNHKEDLFSDYIPIVNKKLFVMENTTKGKFINLAVSEVVDVVMTWIKNANEEKPTHKKNSIATAMAISKLADLYLTYFNNYVVQKIGIFRKHVYGARSHFTFRSVITSIPGPHRYDEVHLPWSIAMTVFRPHLLNKLMRRGHNFNESSRMLFKAVKLYIPELHEIFNELIAESMTPGGIPVMAQRNPSLLSGSAQLLYITLVKTDPDDKTISISGLILKAPNADIDGDNSLSLCA